MAVERYPLHWPEGWKRTGSGNRRRSPFKLAYEPSMRHLLTELQRLGATSPLVPTNMPLRRDGMPMLGRGPIQDPGVAVYFTRKDKQQVLACDQYTSLDGNLHAIGLTVQALRAIDRYGSSTILDRAFTGFAALPAGEHWSKVLGVEPSASVDDIENAYRIKLAIAHPDRGGSTEEFQAVQRALAEATNDRGA